MLKKIQNKKASITTITLFAIMCFLFPMLGVIYDIGLIHIYKQDIKNIQDLSGTTCTPTASGKGLSNNCDEIAKAYVNMNLTGEYHKGGKIPLNGKYDELKGIQNYRMMDDISEDCNGVTKSRICKQGFNINVEKKFNGVGGYNITIETVGLRYKPMFLTGALFSFIRVKNFDSKNNSIELKIPKSSFSATYSYNG